MSEGRNAEGSIESVDRQKPDCVTGIINTRAGCLRSDWSRKESTTASSKQRSR